MQGTFFVWTADLIERIWIYPTNHKVVKGIPNCGKEQVQCTSSSIKIALCSYDAVISLHATNGRHSQKIPLASEVSLFFTRNHGCSAKPNLLSQRVFMHWISHGTECIYVQCLAIGWWLASMHFPFCEGLFFTRLWKMREPIARYTLKMIQYLFPFLLTLSNLSPSLRRISS